MGDLCLFWWLCAYGQACLHHVMGEPVRNPIPVAIPFHKYQRTLLFTWSFRTVHVSFGCFAASYGLRTAAPMTRLDSLCCRLPRALDHLERGLDARLTGDVHDLRGDNRLTRVIVRLRVVWTQALVHRDQLDPIDWTNIPRAS